MKRINDLNINDRSYWNGVYQGEDNRKEYAKVTQGHRGISRRLEFALKEIKNEDKVLDIGCGIGLFTEMVKDTYPSCIVWGTDISSKAIEENKAKRKDIVYYHQYIGSQKQLPSNFFDVVFCGETIEHLEDPSIAFKDAKRVLRRGGKLIITTPNENRIMSPEHVWEFNQEDVEKLFLASDFDSVKFVLLPDMEWYRVIFAIGFKK